MPPLTVGTEHNVEMQLYLILCVVYRKRVNLIKDAGQMGN